MSKPFKVLVIGWIIEIDDVGKKNRETVKSLGSAAREIK